MNAPLESVARALTSRRGARVSLAIGVLVLLGLLGVFGSASLTSDNEAAPPDSESARVAALADRFAGGDQQTLLIVATRHDDAVLTVSDTSELKDLAAALATVDAAKVLGPFPSDDGRAALVQLSATVGADTDTQRALVAQVRTIVAQHPISDLGVQVTGGPAFGFDVAAAFDGADLTLLMVTIAVVALLLIITYRSPVLWLVPLAVVGIADQVANKVTAALGNALDLQFDAGVVSVLVFGAGTNYALLLISRYREQLHQHPAHRDALRAAWRGTATTILASNVTVVVSLLTLALAVIPGTRGLGIACAVGLLIVVAAVLALLTPALALCGRNVFWPLIPRAGGGRAGEGRVWAAVAGGVVHRPWLPLVGGVALLAVMTAGLLGTSVGLSQVAKFRVPSESAAGLVVLGEHFDPGQAQPAVVVASAARAAAVRDALLAVDGVARVSQPTVSRDGSLARLSVVGTPEPGTVEGRDLVVALRDAAHAVPGADALVGGQQAVDVDARAGNLRDFLVVAPLILLLTLLVLVVLLRAVLAPVVLLLVNTLSAAAAIGAGAWLGRAVFGWEALDLQVPLLAFLFLVALGVDYTIFLAHRARTEAEGLGTAAGMARALAATGGVITSAGIVLAGVFAALGLLPLVTLGQIGLIVGVGVLVDTLVVRTLVVPALFATIGDRLWLPGQLRRARDEAPEEREAADHAAASDQPVTAAG